MIDHTPVHSQPLREHFVGEDITPVAATCDTARMAAGEPGLPSQFIWRGKTVEIVTVLRAWHDTGPCSRGSREQYVRRHWYEVATAADGTMKIYFERQPPRGRKGSRWRLFSCCSFGEGS